MAAMTGVPRSHVFEGSEDRALRSHCRKGANLCRRAGERAQGGEGTELRLDLCPEYSADDLAALLRRRFGGRAMIA